jgi:nucleotide-binding universal stress UspA family protein
MEIDMRMKNIVAGIDGSKEGIWAAASAWKLAQRADANCRLIHATYDASSLAAMPPSVNLGEYLDNITDEARGKLVESLRGEVPEEALEAIEVEMGNPSYVVQEAAREAKADLVVLGGRRRTSVMRWLESSTLKHMMRAGDAAVLAAVPPILEFQRVLVAVDQSSMMQPVITWARYFADMFGANVRVLHAVEPLPYDYAASIHQPDEYLGWSRSEFEEQLKTVPGSSDLSWDVVHGPVAATITKEAKKWNADLLVVGSHGKGFVERVLLGSTSTRLANEMPTSLLVVPATAAVETENAPAELEEAVS